VEPVGDRPHGRPPAWQDVLADRDKALVYWALSSLMVAEERITTKFAGPVMAADSEEEAGYLASQQVAEARHCSSMPPPRRGDRRARDDRRARRALARAARSLGALHVDQTGWRTAGDSRALWTAATAGGSIFEIAGTATASSSIS
jgi:hypothetical protein